MRAVPYWYWLLVGLTALGGQLAPQSPFEAIPKLLLMPALWWSFRQHLPRAMQIGLFCAWVGDGALLVPGQPLFFLAGMGAFGLMWVAYALTWWQIPASANRVQFMGILGIGLAWSIGLLMALWPGLEATYRLSLPVYILLLLTSALVAARHRSASLLGGLGLFWLSDSLIAIQQFATALPGGAFTILALYGIAQGFLIAATSTFYTSKRTIS